MCTHTYIMCTHTYICLYTHMLIYRYRPLSKRRKLHPKQFHAYEVRSHSKPVSFMQIQFLIPGISSYARPTALAFWLPLMVNSLIEQISFIRASTQFKYSTIFKLIFAAANSFIVGCVLCFTVDFLTYEAVTFTPINFFVTNILENEVIAIIIIIIIIIVISL